MGFHAGFIAMRNEQIRLSAVSGPSTWSKWLAGWAGTGQVHGVWRPVFYPCGSSQLYSSVTEEICEHECYVSDTAEVIIIFVTELVICEVEPDLLMCCCLFIFVWICKVTNFCRYYDFKRVNGIYLGREYTCNVFEWIGLINWQLFNEYSVLSVSTLIWKNVLQNVFVTASFPFHTTHRCWIWCYCKSEYCAQFECYSPFNGLVWILPC